MVAESICRAGEQVECEALPSAQEPRSLTPETSSLPSSDDENQNPMMKIKERQLVVVRPEPESPQPEYLNGPDQIIPTTAIKTWEPNGAVKVRLGEKGIAATKPLSVPTFLKNTAEKYGKNNALGYKKDDVYHFYTYEDYYRIVRTVAKGFIKLGLDPFHGVCILGFNSPEWFFSNMGAIFAGGFSAGIYTTNSPEACEHCARNCKAQIWVVEEQKYLEKVLKIRDRLPHLKHIVQYRGKPTAEGVLSWDQLMEIGLREPDSELENRLKRMAVNQCCTLIYTSGTTGPPKGVMLSHDNLTWIAQTVASFYNLTCQAETFVSFLPLSHVAAQVADMYVTLLVAATTYFAQPDALKGSLGLTLKEVRPTRFLGVPRVWEKIHEKMMEVGRKTTGIKRTIATWAKAVGLEANGRIQRGDSSKPFGYSIASALVFKKVKQALGLDKCNLFLSGAAPIAVEVLQYFQSLDIPLGEIYGMSESTGPHTSSHPAAFKNGTVGRALEGCYVKLFDADREGNGEVCMSGRNVCMGYLLMEDKTHEAVDDEGWLHSGDIGKLDDDGYLYITGRIKEIIITAGGENIPPVLIEDALKAELPCISNAMLIGDKRKFLSILLTLKTNVSPEGEPLDALSPACVDWCKGVGSSATTVQDVLSCPDAKVMRAIQDGIDRTNKKATSNAQKIQKWTILPRDFSVSSDELGPTLKLKRPVVARKYAETIEKFYQV